ARFSQGPKPRAAFPRGRHRGRAGTSLGETASSGSFSSARSPCAPSPSSARERSTGTRVAAVTGRTSRERRTVVRTRLGGRSSVYRRALRSASPLDVPDRRGLRLIVRGDHVRSELRRLRDLPVELLNLDERELVGRAE